MSDNRDLSNSNGDNPERKQAISDLLDEILKGELSGENNGYIDISEVEKLLKESGD